MGIFLNSGVLFHTFSCNFGRGEVRYIEVPMYNDTLKKKLPPGKEISEDSWLPEWLCELLIDQQTYVSRAVTKILRCRLNISEDHAQRSPGKKWKPRLTTLTWKATKSSNPPSVSAKAAALMSFSKVFAAVPSACSGNFTLKLFKQLKASWNHLNSYKQRAWRKWALVWLGSNLRALWQSRNAA